MNNSEKLKHFYRQVLDWFISVAVTAIVLGFGIKFWDKYSGLSGFFTDFYGILTMSIPIPFWAAVLLGVALSITFYRKRFSIGKFFSSEK